MTKTLLLFLMLFCSFNALSAEHKFYNISDIQWGDGPPFLPAGVKFAVLNGDPAKKGEFTIRLKFPANYQIPAHWHPTAENVTVIEGVLHLGMGDKLDAAKATKMTVGGFTSIPMKHHHFAFSDEGAVVQIHGMGPFAITYINPADDPRNAKKK